MGDLECRAPGNLPFITESTVLSSVANARRIPTETIDAQNGFHLLSDGHPPFGAVMP